MRTAESSCLLCKANKATKENSHVFPKFISKSLLGAGKVKTGYIVSADGVEQIQDTVKEDYVLCPSCEQYFSVLKTYIATRLHNRIRDVRHSDEFSIDKTIDGLKLKICEQINPLIFRLFIYSIVWRCSVSSTRLCKDFKLDIEEEEILRGSLIRCKHEKQNDLLNNISNYSSSIPLISFIFFTSESFANRTSNFLFSNPEIQNPYQISINEYVLLFSFKENELQQKLSFLNNADNSKIKVGFLLVEIWESVRGNIFGIIEDSLKNKQRETGINPLEIKIKSKKS